MNKRPASALVATAVLATAAGVVALEPAQAADASKWNPGYIISDARFYDTMSMTVSQVQTFLNDKGASCVPGTAPCLKNYTAPTTDWAPDAYCKGYKASASQSAAQIIWGVAQACGINPQVLLVTLQKEQGLVTSTRPTTGAYTIAMGFGCPDTAACNTAYYGFFNQLYRAARQFKVYAAKPTSFNYRAGMNNTIRYSPNAACGASTVYITNQATASLYNYTPYQPNKAALTNLYGTGDSCSAYGNRNFWRTFTDWFGDPRAGISPFGGINLVQGATGAIIVQGWAIDPDAATTPVQIHVYIGGPPGKGEFHYIGPASLSRSDVASRYPDAGLAHGFNKTIQTLKTGNQKVYIYAANVAGTSGSNVLLGIKTVKITPRKVTTHNPIGAFDRVTANGQLVNVQGWALDQDLPGAALTIRAYVGGPAGKGELHNLGATNVSRPDVAAAHRDAGLGHGFNSTFTTKKTGKQTIYIYAVNVGKGTNKLLGTRTITIAAGYSPQGAVESVAADAGQVTVQGWAFDRNVPTTPINITVCIGGPRGSTGCADMGVTTEPRPDIAAKYTYAGLGHGFSFTIPTDLTGDQPVYVYAINRGPGSDVLLGSSTVTIPEPPQ